MGNYILPPCGDVVQNSIVSTIDSYIYSTANWSNVRHYLLKYVSIALIQ